MNENTCYGCAERHFRCHGNYHNSGAPCPKYAKLQAQNAERNAQRAAEVRADNDYREAKKRTKRIAERNDS